MFRRRSDFLRESQIQMITSSNTPTFVVQCQDIKTVKIITHKMVSIKLQRC
jgi:hypothetical protein